VRLRSYHGVSQIVDDKRSRFAPRRSSFLGHAEKSPKSLSDAQTQTEKPGHFVGDELDGAHNGGFHT
jgi:hypothetical protein